MKNLYTFLKEYKQLRESTTSERAAELGYEWQRRSVWLDPKTGKRYRADGTKFTEIPDGTGIEKPSSEPKKVEPKTLDQFRKEVPKQTPTVSSVPSDPADDEQEAEMRAVAASQGLWPHYTNARKDYHINRELQQIQSDREAAQAELEVQQPEPEVPQEPQVEEPPQKDPEEFRTIDDVINQQKQSEKLIDLGSEVKTSKDIKTEKQLDQVNDLMKEENPTPEDIEEVIDSMDDLRKLITDSAKAEKTEKQYTKFMDKVYKPFEDLISKMDDDQKNSYVALIANSYKYTGRTNTGAGLNSLGRFDVEQLSLAKDRILKYDFEDKDSVEEFVRSIRRNEVSDEFVDATFELLPKSLTKAWAKKGMAGKGELGKNHFLGYDKDGNEMRGQGGVNRSKLMWRMYLEQNGRDGYTGLPLNIENFDLEHIRPASGAGNDLEEFKTREHEKNQVLTNSNVNQAKSDLSMNEFFEKQVDPLSTKGDDYWDNRGKIFDYRNTISSKESQMKQSFLDKDGNFSKNLTPELFMEMIDNHESTLKKDKKDLGVSAKESGDKELQSAWSSIETQSKLAKNILTSIPGKLPRGYNKQKLVEGSKPRSNSLGSDNYYRGVLLSMIGKSPEEQEKIKKVYRDAIRYAEDSGGGDSAFASYMVENGGIDMKVISNYKGISKIFKSLQESLSDYGRSFISKYNKNNKFL